MSDWLGSADCTSTWVNTAITHASWPIAALIALYLFREPLISLLRSLRFLKSGSLEFRFAEGLRKQGLSAEQLSALAKLTADEINYFLMMSYSSEGGFTYTTTLSQDQLNSLAQNLAAAGLVTIEHIDQQTHHIKHRVTYVGQSLRMMLIDSAIDLLGA
ncbi:hypothetical protein [Chitinimonas naiadis]